MNIIEELYFGNLSEFSRPIKNINAKEQVELYNKIKEYLGSSKEKLLDDFLDLETEYNEKLLMQRYINGFKTGLLIGIEIHNFDA